MTAVEPADRQKTRFSWKSDTLVLATLNTAAYVWLYWDSGWQVPHFGTYVGWIGVLISLVPAVRESRTAHLRPSALVGVILSCGVFLHILLTPCTGPCK